MEAIHTTTRSSRAELRADVTALLDAAHHLTSGRVDAPPKWRGEVDLNSLTRDKLEAFLHDRGMTAPPSYRCVSHATTICHSHFSEPVRAIS